MNVRDSSLDQPRLCPDGGGEVAVTDGQCVGDRCEKCTKSGRAPEENLVGLAGEQGFSSL